MDSNGFFHLSARLSKKSKEDVKIHDALNIMSHKTRRGKASIIILALSEYLKNEGYLNENSKMHKGDTI